jgi:hypothetical protein
MKLRGLMQNTKDKEKSSSQEAKQIKKIKEYVSRLYEAQVQYERSSAEQDLAKCVCGNIAGILQMENILDDLQQQGEEYMPVDTQEKE